MTDKETPKTQEGSNENVENENTNAPDVEALQASNKELSEKIDKLTRQYEAQKNSHQAEIRKLKKETDIPKEDTERIATLELRLARSEAVAEYGLDAEDVAMFKGTPDEIKEQAAHFASKFSQKTESTNKSEEDNTETTPKETPKETPKPKKKELSTLERYKRGTAEERRIMMEKAKRGEIDLAK